MDKVIHILRYGTVGEKTHIENAVKTYDYLGINGNSAAYVSSAIAKFVVEKFFRDETKGFFIDPITYAFQSNIHLLSSDSKSGETHIKKSISKLIDYYKEPVDKVITSSPVTPADFKNATVNEEFCSRVLGFQYSVVTEYIQKEKLGKYLNYVSEEDCVNQKLQPKFLIAPYFYLNSSDRDFSAWLDINIAFLDSAVIQAREKFDGIPVFAQIVINKEILLKKELLGKIIKAYNHCICSGLTFWVDDFDEHEVDAMLLEGFIYFLSGLQGKPIYNMYGGYFSILLTHRQIGLLNGVSHGMEYGESRAVYPVGGGLPVSKYYFLPLHRRNDFTKAFYLLEHNHVLDTSIPNWGNCDKYYEEICHCEQCKRIMLDEMRNFVKFESDLFYEVKRNNRFTRRKKASPATKENCLYHFLLCKYEEFDSLKSKKLDVLLDELQQGKKKYDSCTLLEEGELDYLEHWYEVLKKYGTIEQHA